MISYKFITKLHVCRYNKVEISNAVVIEGRRKDIKTGFSKS